MSLKARLKKLEELGEKRGKVGSILSIKPTDKEMDKYMSGQIEIGSDGIIQWDLSLLSNEKLEELAQMSEEN